MSTVSEVSHEIPIDKDSPTPREFDILDVLLILAARKGTIFLATVAGLALGIGLVFLVRPLVHRQGVHPASHPGSVER